MILDGYCTLGTDRETRLSPDQLLTQMTNCGVDQAVIAPDDRELALFNAAGNERIARIAEQSNGRLIAACTVSPWHGADAPRLLKSAVDAGARMLVFAPALQGFNPCDELVDPLVEAAASLTLPIYVHTGPHSVGAPTQVVSLALRHPAARFILAHCGSTDYGWDMPTILGLQLPNVWFELSFVRPWAVANYGKLTDESRLIFASSAPRNNLNFELRQLQQWWPIANHPATYGGNLQRLLAEVRP